MLLECARIGNVVASPIDPAGCALHRVLDANGLGRERVMRPKSVRA
jgi:hypothetical protein